MSTFPKITQTKTVVLSTPAHVGKSAPTVNLRVTGLRPTSTKPQIAQPQVAPLSERAAGLLTGYASGALKIAEGYVHGVASVITQQVQSAFPPMVLLNQPAVAHKVARLTGGASDVVLQPWVAMGEMHRDRTQALLDVWSDPLQAAVNLGQHLHRDLVANPLQTYDDVFRFGETGLMAMAAVTGLGRWGRWEHANAARRWDNVIDLPRGAWSRVDEPGGAQVKTIQTTPPKAKFPAHSAAPASPSPGGSSVVLRPVVPVMNTWRNVFWPQAIAMPTDPEGLGRGRPSHPPSAEPSSRRAAGAPTPEYTAGSNLKQVKPANVAKALLGASPGALRELVAQLQQRETRAASGGVRRYAIGNQTHYMELKARVNNSHGSMAQLLPWLQSALKSGENAVQSIELLIAQADVWGQGRAHVPQIDDSIQAIAQLEGPVVKVLELLAQGYSAKVIAQRLGITKQQVTERHFPKIFKALGVFSPPDLSKRYPGSLEALALKVEQVKQNRRAGPPIKRGDLKAVPHTHLLPILADLVSGMGRPTLLLKYSIGKKTLSGYESKSYAALGVKNLDELIARYGGENLRADLRAEYARRKAGGSLSGQELFQFIGAGSIPTTTAGPVQNLSLQSSKENLFKALEQVDPRRLMEAADVLDARMTAARFRAEHGVKRAHVVERLQTLVRHWAGWSEKPSAIEVPDLLSQLAQPLLRPGETPADFFSRLYQAPARWAVEAGVVVQTTPPIALRRLPTYQLELLLLFGANKFSAQRVLGAQREDYHQILQDHQIGNPDGQRMDTERRYLNAHGTELRQALNPAAQTWYGLGLTYEGGLPQLLLDAEEILQERRAMVR